jgi:hypothetical protein
VEGGNEVNKDKYVFEWCKDCTYLNDCYYQHGFIDGPKLLDPSCAEGPVLSDDEVSDLAYLASGEGEF